MKELILERLQLLAGTLRHLHGRVREAVAGEVGKAVADAVADVVAAGLSGGAGYAAAYGHPPSRGRSAWDDDPGWDGDDPYSASGNRRPSAGVLPRELPSAETALAVAWAAGRWWLGRRGGAWGAAGVALAAAGSLAVRGPTLRAVLGVLWAVHRLSASTDALGDGATALDRD